MIPLHPPWSQSCLLKTWSVGFKMPHCTIHSSKGLNGSKCLKLLHLTLFQSDWLGHRKPCISVGNRRVGGLLEIWLASTYVKIQWVAKKLGPINLLMISVWVVACVSLATDFRPEVALKVHSWSTSDLGLSLWPWLVSFGQRSKSHKVRWCFAKLNK